MLAETLLGQREPVVVLVGDRIDPPAGEDPAGVYLQVSDQNALALHAVFGPLIDQLATPMARRELRDWMSAAADLEPSVLDEATELGIVVEVGPDEPLPLIRGLGQRRLAPLVPFDVRAPEAYVSGRVAVRSPGGERLLVWPETAAAIWEEPAQQSLEEQLTVLAEIWSSSREDVARSIVADLHAVLGHRVAVLRDVEG